MVVNRIRQALVLATETADDGSLLALTNLGGLPLLKRTLLVLRKSGVRRAVVVAPSQVAMALRQDPQLSGLEIVWCAGKERGASAILRAKGMLRGDFFLVPCDHVFAPAILERLQEEPLDGVTLAVDRQRDVDSRALPVQTTCDGRIQALGSPDAPWFATGLATCDDTLFDVLEYVGGTSLADAYGYLARHGAARVASVEQSQWQQVRSKPGRHKAEQILLQSLRKPEFDGVVAKWINRRFSLAVTRLLMNSRVRPNHVTFLTLLLSLAAGAVAAMATPATAWYLAVGAVLWQLASMLDGTDGELARLKFQGSRIGEWFDTLTDDIGRMVFFLGLGYGGWAVTGQLLWFQLGVASVLMQLAVNLVIYRKLLQVGAGSHFALAWSNDDRSPPRTPLARLLKRIEFMGRRDWYAFSGMCLVVVGRFDVALVLTFIITAIVTAHEIVKPRQARPAFVEAHATRAIEPRYADRSRPAA